MKVIIDRFESNFAVVELPDRTMANLPKVLVPDSHESDIVDISIDKSETEKRKSEINKMMDDLFE